MSGAKIIQGLQEAIDYTRGWQPIETAPKDGRDILLWTTSEGDLELTEYLEAAGEVALPLLKVQIGFWDGREWSLHLVGSPTHWMPLPKPPGGAA